MQWNRIRSKILALHRFDFQPKLKEKNLPSGILPIPRLFLELAMSELSPIEFKIFLKLYSMLDFELRTHWVIGISTQELAELCYCKKTIIYKALDELKRKGYIYILSGRKAKKKAKAIRKLLYGSAVDFGGNDYNAYSLLPFFTRVFIELDTQRLEEGENENPLPSDEEVLAELPRETTNALKSLGDNDENDTSVYIDLTTNALKSLGDNDENDTSVYIDQPQSIETNLGLYRPTSVYIDDDQQHTNQKNTNQRHTHQRQEESAEKNRLVSENSGPAPADGLSEIALNLLTLYLSRSENVRSPIAVLKSLTEAQLETLACDALSWFLTYYVSDWELREEVDRLMSEHGIKCVELLEYVQLSEEGKVEWLKKKGVLKDGND
ncbi:MAG: hypothetical protein DSY42_02175 [Aquifex sp.]|nr:MAG: hypothetical protein DSY42_02175 [Aquifex sp.]